MLSHLIPKQPCDVGTIIITAFTYKVYKVTVQRRMESAFPEYLASPIFEKGTMFSALFSL